MKTAVINPTPIVMMPAPPAVVETSDYCSRVLRPNHHYKSAIVMTKRATMIAPTSRELWVNLAAYFIHTQDYDEAMGAVERALSIDPKYAIAHAAKGMIYDGLKDFDEAEIHYGRAIEIDPNYLDVVWNRALMRLGRGDYLRGFEDYESRIKSRKIKDRFIYPKFNAPFWQGEDLSDKTIYVAAEQGIGDMIMFSRFLPWLAQQAKHVYICCTRDVTSLLWEFRRFVEFVPEGVPIPKTDYAIIIGSLPHRYGVTLDTLPADPGLIKTRVDVHQTVGPAELPELDDVNALKLGLCWTGNPGQDRSQERDIPFPLLLDLLEHPHIWAYSFQLGPSEDDIRKNGANRLVYNLAPQMMRGLAVTGTALQKMDLVITACTSIAHLCGALGVPCWVLLPYDAYWVWLQERSDSPWYPSIRLFRQKKPGDWAQVLRDVQTALYDKLEKSHG